MILSRRIPVTRASFTLTDRAALTKAVAAASRWIRTTTSVNLSHEAELGSPFEEINHKTGSTASALRVDDTHGTVWAAQVEFRGDRTANRVWKTEIFVEQQQGAFARFGAQLTCEIEQSDPGFEHSRPRVIQNVLEELSAEADDNPLTNAVEPVGMAYITDFSSLLYNPTRRLPVVLVSVDDDGGSQVNLNRLATRLSGVAHLRSIAIEESYELSRQIGNRMSAYNGAVRLYMPGLTEQTEDPFEHPLWLAPRTGFNSRIISQLAYKTLPLGFQDGEGDARFWRVSLLRQTATRALADLKVGNEQEQLLAEIAALKSERANALNDARAAEDLMYEEANKRRRVETDFARAKDENFNLRERLRYESLPHTTSSALSPNDVRSVFDQNPSLETTLRVIQSLFPDRVEVLDTALESARDSAAFIYTKKAFSLLWALCTDYWVTLSNGEGDVSARQSFGAAYAAKENETLSVGGRKRRTFSYNGELMKMYKHLKIGVADNKSETLRVHFEWIAGENKIVIGYCGGHLDF